MSNTTLPPALAGQVEPSVRPGAEARERMHAAFRELGYTTNSQTSELLDIVFMHCAGDDHLMREALWALTYYRDQTRPISDCEAVADRLRTRLWA